MDLEPEDLSFLPIPQVGSGLLEGAMAVPKWPYLPRFHEKAAALHFHLIQDHPFIDGNKRFALAAAEFFLLINGAFLRVSDKLSVEMGLAIASGTMSKAHLTDLDGRRIQMHHWTLDETEAWISNLPDEDIEDLDRTVEEDLLKSPALERTGYRASGLRELVQRRRSHITPPSLSS